jgi:carotenoid cleavage dioxygenase-like enzyme
MKKLCIDACYQEDSTYPSEAIFVANPDGTTEDDGVLLSQIYDGIRRETALLVLDAKTMDVQATVWTGQRSPMDFHGAWIPS